MKEYLVSVRKQFEYYKLIAEKSFEQLPDQALFWQPNEESNSIAMIVKHLSGNMLSRWTDVFTSDGEKAWRNRDSEFEPTIESRHEMMEVWNRGWTCLFSTMDLMCSDDLEKIVYIRNEGHTLCEALNRQLAHYPYHVGQIVFIAKVIAHENWKSLSIPRNQSGSYNKKKFGQPKGLRNFTDGAGDELWGTDPSTK